MWFNLYLLKHLFWHLWYFRKISILEPIHLCRNRGGTDVTVCSTNDANKFERTGNLQKDLICGSFRPLVRYCHIVGLNNPSNGVHYKFSPYSSFDSASAHSVCEEIGGNLPNLETELDFFYLTDQMKLLLAYVSLGQPFSLRWMSWPVSIYNKMDLFILDILY